MRQPVVPFSPTISSSGGFSDGDKTDTRRCPTDGFASVFFSFHRVPFVCEI